MKIHTKVKNKYIQGILWFYYRGVFFKTKGFTKTGFCIQLRDVNVHLRYSFIFCLLFMFKRVALFLGMNIAIMIMIGIVAAILGAVFNINLYGTGIVEIALFSLVVGFMGAFISLAISRWIAKRMYHIVLLNDSNVSQASEKERFVYELVVRLSAQSGIKTPEVGVYVDSDANAFATGPSKNSSLVAVSTALLEQCNLDEIEGVVAHEMAHILNGDMVTMTLLQGVLNTFVIFLSRIIAQFIDQATDGKMGWLGYQLVYILLQILFGILATIIAMKFSRYREFRADHGSALLVGKAKMIAALKRLKALYPETVAANDGQLSAFKISSGEKKTSLFASHPSLDDRIKALEEDYQLV